MMQRIEEAAEEAEGSESAQKHDATHEQPTNDATHERPTTAAGTHEQKQLTATTVAVVTDRAHTNAPPVPDEGPPDANV